MIWPFRKTVEADAGGVNTLCFEASVEVQAAKDKGPPKVSILAYSGGVMSVAGWGSVAIDLAGLDIPATVPILADHEAALDGIVGQGSAKVAKGSLQVDGKLTGATEAAKTIVQLAKDGFTFQASVGVEPSASKYISAGESVQVNGQTLTAPEGQGFTLIEARKLREVSITALGADDTTAVSIAAKQPKGTETMPTDLETARRRAADEERRLDRIRAVASRFAEVGTVEIDGREVPLADAKAEAITAGWDPDKFELHCVRSSYPSAPAGNFFQAGRPADINGNVLQGILFCRAGFENIGEKVLGARTMEAANQYRTLSLVDFARLALTAAGRQVPINRNEMIRAAFSTNTMTEALGGSMDKLLGFAFLEASATWRSFTMKKDLSNFREHSVISPQHRGQLEQLGKDGEIKHGFLGDDSTTLQLATYAKMIGVTRQDIVNDDLGVFSDIFRVFAIQAARKVNDLVWAVIMANAGSHFHADNNNLLTGATSALDLDSLALAVQYMRKQRDADNNDLDIRPKVLAVPPELEVTARSILSSIEVSRVTNDNDPTGNALKDIAALEVEPRLSNTAKVDGRGNAAFPNASTTAWFLFSGQENAPVYYGTLDGQETPVVEFFGLTEGDTHRLGVQWRVYIDAGAALGEPASAVKSAGA
jgi:hypothetical protein